MKIKNILSSILLLLVITGCSTTPKVAPPSYRTSEVGGAGVADLGLSYTQAFKLILVEDLRSTPLSKESSTKKSSTGLLFGSLGLTDSIDIEYSWGPSLSPYAGGNFQLINTSGFSLNFRVGGSYSVSAGEISASEVEASGNKKTAREYVMNSYSILYSGGLGYRIIEPLTVYFLYSLEEFGHFIDFIEGIEDEIPLDGTLTSMSLGVEYRLGSLFSTFSISKSEIEIEQDPSDNKSELLYGLSIGLSI